MTIAEALLLRKQLDAKVKQLEPLKIQGESGVYDLKIERIKVSEDVDQARIMIPKLQPSDITREYDHYATQLRKIDTAIQKANWAYSVDFTEVPLIKA